MSASAMSGTERSRLAIMLALRAMPSAVAVVDVSGYSLFGGCFFMSEGEQLPRQEEKGQDGKKSFLIEYSLRPRSGIPTLMAVPAPVWLWYRCGK